MNEKIIVSPTWNYEDEDNYFFGATITINGLEKEIFIGPDSSDYGQITNGELLNAGVWDDFFDVPFDEDDNPMDDEAWFEQFRFSDDLQRAISEAMDEAERQIKKEKDRTEFSEPEECADSQNGYAVVHADNAPFVKPSIIGVYASLEDAEQAFKVRNWWLFDREGAAKQGLLNTGTFDRIMQVKDGELFPLE